MSVETTIQNLLEYLQTLLKEPFISNCKGEVEGLITDLTTFNEFLKDPKSREYEVVKELVAQIRDLTYEVEDAIDAFVLEATVSKAKKWLQKVFHTADHANMLREVATKVKATIAKVQNVRKNLLFGAGSESNKGGEPADGSRAEKRLPYIKKDNVVGFDDAKYRILDRLMGEPEDLQVISIIGMGGLGKTTLANKVYNDPLIRHEFSTFAWIYVSQVYSPCELFLAILEDVTEVIGDMSTKGEDELAKEVCRQLTSKYLIVVDDVWKEEDWDKIKKAFPDHKNGSRILLTTRHKLVADHANPQSPPHDLDFLTHSQSWELLQKEVFGQGYCPQEDLKDVGITISTQCDGLPLAVVVIAGMLQADKRKAWWETVAKSVKAFLVRNEEDLTEVLALSYYDLQPHLKACFLYFGVFPEDYRIPFWLLIRLWIAERFVQTDEKVSLEEKLSLEEMAEDYLEALVARNLVLVEQRSFSGKIKTCRIHDMLRDLCLREALAQNFLLEIKEGGSNSSSYLTPAVSTINRRLCIHSGVLTYIATKPSRPHVRSFLCFAKDKVNLPSAHVGYIPDEFKLLRVYHVQPISFPRFPSEIEQLAHLSYIAFSGDFNTIPAAVSNLWSLQTLIAETTSTSHTIDIKADISKMSKLRHLHTNKPSELHDPIAKNTKDHESASSNEIPKPSKLRHLQSTKSSDIQDLIAKKSKDQNQGLQTLTTIMPESCTQGVLGQTPDLKKLGIRGKLATLFEEKGGSLFNNLTKLEQLVTLKLLNDVLSDPPSESRLQRLPPCNNFPPNLKRLTLANTFLEWEQMHVLGMLPALEELKLKDNAFTGVRWRLVNGDFRQLKVLQIWKTDLEYMETEADSFPSLQHIVLKDCTKLWEIPSSLGNQGKLQTIKLHKTSVNAANSARKINEQRPEIKVDIFASDI